MAELSKVKKLKHIDNPDKKGHEKWSESRKMINFPHPYRCLISGPPNSGKTTCVLNLLVGATPIFDNIFIIHPQSFETNIEESSERVNKDILIPTQLVEQLDRNKLRNDFDTLTASRKKDILKYLSYVKTQETLLKNIDKLINQLKNNEKNVRIP